MVVLGIRPVTEGAHWIVVAGTQRAAQLIKLGEIKKPKSYDSYEALTHLREKLKELLNQYQPQVVMVRDNDSARGTKKFYPRVRAEAVALEVANAEGKRPSLVGWKSIAAKLSAKQQKATYKAAAAFHGVDCSDLSNEQIDALHAAVAGLPRA